MLGDSATEAVEVPGDGAGGEEGEGGGMVFRVTRHTPRPLPGGLKGGQRRLPTPEQSLQYSAGKRMKLDDTARLATGSKGQLCGHNTISCIYNIRIYMYMYMYI